MNVTEKMDYLIEYIENEKINGNDLNLFLQENYKDLEIKDIPNLGYVFLALNIRNIELNEFSKKLYNDIVEFYKNNENNKYQIGLQMIKWYNDSGKIGECIKSIYKMLDKNYNDSILELLYYLIDRNKLSDRTREIADYILEFVNDVERFDFRIYKLIMMQLDNAKGRDSFNEYIYFTCDKINVFEKYIDKCIIENFNFEQIDDMIQFEFKLKWSWWHLEEILEIETPKNRHIAYVMDNCMNNNISFYDTKTCKMLIYIYLYTVFGKETVNHFIVENYVKYNKNKILYDLESSWILNKKYGLITTNDFKNLEKYRDTITKKLRLSIEEKEIFVNDLTYYKYNYGLFPLDICKYIIFCVLKYDEFHNIKVCILRDFMTNLSIYNGINNITCLIENDNDERTLSYLGSAINVNSKDEDFVIRIDLANMEKFAKDDIRVLDTIYHETEHIIQDNNIIKENWIGNTKKMYIEKLLAYYDYRYTENNYYEKYCEIEARLAGAQKTINLIDELEIDWNILYVNKTTGKTNALTYFNEKIDECEELLKNADYKYITNKEEKESILEYFDKNKEKLEKEYFKEKNKKEME